MAQKPPVGQGLLGIEASWSHSDTPHTIERIWTHVLVLLYVFEIYNIVHKYIIPNSCQNISFYKYKNLKHKLLKYKVRLI